MLNTNNILTVNLILNVHQIIHYQINQTIEINRNKNKWNQYIVITFEKN